MLFWDPRIQSFIQYKQNINKKYFKNSPVIGILRNLKITKQSNWPIKKKYKVYACLKHKVLVKEFVQETTATIIMPISAAKQ